MSRIGFVARSSIVVISCVLGSTFLLPVIDGVVPCVPRALAQAESGEAEAAPSLLELKRSGRVGESIDGYLGIVRGDLDAESRALVERINAERNAEYARIAAKQGATLEQVAAIAGAKLVAAAPTGQMVRDSTGTWKQK